METLVVLLPTRISEIVSTEAGRRNVSPAMLCSGIISDYFLAQLNEVSGRESADRGVPIGDPATKSSTSFNVADHFAGYPKKSIDLAQEFVNQALSIQSTEAFVANGTTGARGIGFSPNFVFIQYLQKREPGGI